MTPSPLTPASVAELIATAEYRASPYRSFTALRVTAQSKRPSEYTTAELFIALSDALQASERRAEDAEISSDHWQREFKHHNKAEGGAWEMRQRAKEAERLLAESDAALLHVATDVTGNDELWPYQVLRAITAARSRIRTAAQGEAKDGAD